MQNYSSTFLSNRIGNFKKQKLYNNFYKKKVGLSLPIGYQPIVYSRLLGRRQARMKQWLRQDLSMSIENKENKYVFYHQACEMVNGRKNKKKEFDSCWAHLKIATVVMLIPCVFMLLYCQRQFNQNSNINGLDVASLAHFGSIKDNFNFELGESKIKNELFEKPNQQNWFDHLGFEMDEEEFEKVNEKKDETNDLPEFDNNQDKNENQIIKNSSPLLTTYEDQKMNET